MSGLGGILSWLARLSVQEAEGAVKDRLPARNPLAAVYRFKGYYRYRRDER